ncbi:hypothetical protein Taro_051034 [Colocasia esculenta]|uniref:Uncharacterized protein n=1 Tax=Colocasia esculenta TaxID=4460 RepID=A0A843XFP9_COLES|nr:hypothetical protein [Colocasia esculenta]
MVVLTQSQAVSTLDPVSRRPNCLTGTEYPDFVMVVSTQSQAVSTLVPVSRRPSCLTGTVCQHSPRQCRH